MAERLNFPQAFSLLKEAHQAGRLTIFTDPSVLNRPGSPVFAPLEVFVPPVVLLASSLTLLFAVGLIAWIVAIVGILVLQRFVFPRIVEWRLHRRAVALALSDIANFVMLWRMGGIAIAIKDTPERHCAGPAGDWRAFIARMAEPAVPQATDQGAP